MRALQPLRTLPVHSTPRLTCGSGLRLKIAARSLRTTRSLGDQGRAFGSSASATAAAAAAARQPILAGLPGSSPSTNPSFTTAPSTSAPVASGTEELLLLPRGMSHSRGLLLISIPIPPTSWPARLEMASPLLSAANRTLKHSLISVNIVYDGFGTATQFQDKENYRARLYFPDGRSVGYENFNGQILQSAAFGRDVSYTPSAAAGGTSASGGNVGGGDVQEGRERHHPEIWVCTHGSRDCRCSDKGGPLVEALRREVKHRGLEGKVRIGEIAHVGGHKYAANAILVPSLDMLSNLTVSHAPALVSHLLGGTPPGPMWAHWRGRYGLSAEAQAELWAQVDPEHLSAEIDVHEAAPTGQSQSEVTLRFKTFEGDVREVKAKYGENLLEVGKRNDLPSIEGVCGGHLECATCHLYVPASSPAGSAPLPEPSDEELDMLGYAVGYRDGESRLGCQIKVTKELEEWVGRGGFIGLPRF